MDLISLLFLVVIILFIFASLRREFIDSKEQLAEETAQPLLESTPEYLVYPGNTLHLADEIIHDILIKHHPYYTQLDPKLKLIFILRIQYFLQQKVFIIHDTKGYREMPILVSASAVQLTMGLKHFSLPWFQYIQIQPDAYFAKDSSRLLAGNVAGNSITVAWKYLLDGYKNSNDGSNVGLHEMAHALYYQFIHADEVKKKRFVQCFNAIVEDGIEIFSAGKIPGGLFIDDAYKNLHEIWAVSIELFFEKPITLQFQYPNLFDTISDLLRQDTRHLSWPVLVVQE